MLLNIFIVILWSLAGAALGFVTLKIYYNVKRTKAKKEPKLNGYKGVKSKMKIMTVVGTRPEVIRLSKIIGKLDTICEKHIVVHTGQNYDDNLNKVFFDELEIRPVDYALETKGNTTMTQLSNMFQLLEHTMKTDRPDRVLILGDTNSCFATAYTAKRMGIPVYHMEAGNRCFDPYMPEELNRRAIDSMADIHMPYTELARRNLLEMGIPDNKIFVTGNPINEVLHSLIFSKTAFLHQGDVRPFVLVTAHREENVDNQERLTALLNSCRDVSQQLAYKVYFSRHPRTKARMEQWKLSEEGIEFHEPIGLHDFVIKERQSKCILTDSGTVQEEACIWGIPCVTLRDNTERPETIECGANILSGIRSDDVVRSVKLAIANKGNWTPPAEYKIKNVSDIVVNIVTGY